MTDVERSVSASGRLSIDLAALKRNYRLIAGLVAPARVAPVVKADAYGLGAFAVSKVLRKAGCTHFFVAQLEEALALKRQLPVDVTLMVLNGLMPGTEEACACAGIVPVLNSLEQAMAWSAVAEKLGRPLPASLQFDTGMSRLGVSLEAAARLANDPAFRTSVPLMTVMSHLACAETRDHLANEHQRSTFEALSDMFPGVPRSLANSGAAFFPSDFHGDFVRAGIALYGGAPSGNKKNPMHPVVQVEARVIQIRTVPAGTPVGYGLSFTAERESHIATIGVGYADGWLRSLSHCGAAWFQGVRLPIAGRISMDSATLDVTELPEGMLKPGDWVELVGSSQSIDDVARDAGTISYEVLTRLGSRFHRTYVDDVEECSLDSEVRATAPGIFAA